MYHTSPAKQHQQQHPKNNMTKAYLCAAVVVTMPEAADCGIIRSPAATPAAANPKTYQ
jgi:hypothetical protein